MSATGLPGRSIEDTQVDHAQVDHIELDHVEFYVGDAGAAAAAMVEELGFRVSATTDGAADDTADRRSIALRQGAANVVLTQGLVDDHPASAYVAAHGDGVAGIALRTRDARAAFRRAVRGGARPLAEPIELPGSGGWVTAVIGGFGDVVHTFVQPPAGLTGWSALPGFVPADGAAPEPTRGLLHRIDHFAICLEAGQLSPTVSFYESALGFRTIFEERISVGTQAMLSKVVQNPARDVTLTLIEPDTAADPGQIDAFLKNHGGAGVQHVAYAADDIVQAVRELFGRGVEFLSTPDSYYEMLGDRLSPQAYTVEDLRGLGILADEDHDGQLFQIFSKSSHPRKTLFLEVIQRFGANTFGSRNIKALYEAVQHEQIRSEDQV